METIERIKKFEELPYKQFCLEDNDDYVFTENPVMQIQAKCLEPVLQITGMRKGELEIVFDVSNSSLNNILGNDSMTNSRPTPISRPQFITLLTYLQLTKKNRKYFPYLIFFLFSNLCAGLLGQLNFDNYKTIIDLAQKDCMPDDLLLQNFMVLMPGAEKLILSFNRFIEWQKNAPEKGMNEYLGVPELNEYIDYSNNLPKSNGMEDYKKAIENAEEFIPLYIKWFVSKMTEGLAI